MDSPCETLAGSYGEQFVNISGGMYVYQKDGSVQHVVRNTQMRELIKFSNKLFREKLINQQWFMMSPEDVEQELKSGNIAIYFTNDLYRWLSVSTFQMAYTIQDRYIPMKLPTIDGRDAVRYNYLTNRPVSSVYITDSCSDPERAVAYLNWLAGDVGQYVSRLGSEGLWQLDNEGQPYVNHHYVGKTGQPYYGSYSDFGYGKWCWQQNMAFENDIMAALLSEEKRPLYDQYITIMEESAWHVPELDNIYIDAASLEGVANININIYFEKLLKSLLIAKDELQSSVFPDTVIFDMDNIGLEILEDEMNRQILRNREQLEQQNPLSDRQSDP